MLVRLNIRGVTIVAMGILVIGCSNPSADFKKAETANSEQAYTEFIDRYPKDPLAAEARIRVCHLAYEGARSVNTVEALQEFISRCGDLDEARLAAVDIENLEFDLAAKSSTVTAWEDFLSKHPQSNHTPAAKESLAALLLEEAIRENTAPAYQSILVRFPETAVAREAKSRVAELEYQGTIKDGTVAAYKQFLDNYSDSDHANEVRAKLEAKEEEDAWNQAVRYDSPASYLGYMRSYPNSERIKIFSGTLHGEVFLTFTADFDPGKTMKAESSGGYVLVTIDGVRDFKPKLDLQQAASLGIIDYIPTLTKGVGFVRSKPIGSAKVAAIKHGKSWKILAVDTAF